MWVTAVKTVFVTMVDVLNDEFDDVTGPAACLRDVLKDVCKQGI